MSSEIDLIAMPTPCCRRKAESGAPLGEVCRIAGVASPGHAYQGTSREPRRALYLSRNLGPVTPNPKEPGPMGHEGSPREANKPSTRRTCRQGKPEAQGRVGEQSYDSIAPMKVENRRAPGRAATTSTGGKG